jgi:hypothetical protein
MSQEFPVPLDASQAVPRQISDISNALSALGSSFAGNSPPTDPAPVQGRLWYEADTGILQFYNGAAWVPVAGGQNAYNDYAVDTTLTIANGFVSVDCSGGDVNITLPTAVGLNGKVFTIIKRDDSSNLVLIIPDGSEKINGGGGDGLRQLWESMSIVSDGANWKMWVSTSGRLLRRTIKTTDTTYTTARNSNKVLIQMVGGGGGGGSIDTSGTAVAAGGGGGGGGYAEAYLEVTELTTYTVAIGAGGAGGTGAGGNPGAQGGDTTFSNGITLVTAYGGYGGNGSVETSVHGFTDGGIGGDISTNGDLNISGGPGSPGIMLDPKSASGNGGSSHFGGGERGWTTNHVGADARVYGAGGSGANSLAGIVTEFDGGDGSAGVIIIWDFSG